jgi:hypothetical protein
MKTEPREGLVAAPPDKRELWDQFRHDRELIDRLRITPQEIEALERCAFLGTLTCKQDLLFILRQIREATGPITAERLVELRPVLQHETFFEEPVLPIIRTHPIAPTQLAQHHLPEHLGIPFWALILAGGLMWNVAIWIYRWREHFIAASSAAPPSVSWLASLDDFSVLIGWEIMFVGCILGVVHLRSSRRHRRLKVRPV